MTVSTPFNGSKEWPQQIIPALSSRNNGATTSSNNNNDVSELSVLITWLENVPHKITFFVGIGLMISSIVLNSLILAGIRKDPSLRAVTYYYTCSMCIGMLLMAIVSVPPNVALQIIGKQPNNVLDTLCIVWIYLDTFLCNLVFLHSLGSTIDTWLRLRYPLRYTTSTSKGSTCLKLGAPWSVSFIQTTAEFSISKHYDNLLQSGVCLHRDPNFLILRTCMSYSLPGIASFVLLIMGFRQFAVVRRNEDPELVSDLLRSFHQQQSYGDLDGESNGVIDLTEDRTMERDLTHETLISNRTPSRDVSGIFELSRMTPIPEACEDGGSSHGGSIPPPPPPPLINNYTLPARGNGAAQMRQSRSSTFKPRDNQAENYMLRSSESYHAGVTGYSIGESRSAHCLLMPSPSSSSGHALPHELDTGIVLNSNYDDYSISSGHSTTAFGTNTVTTAEEMEPVEHRIKPHQQQHLNYSWRRMLHLEKRACTINLAIFFVNTIFWSPYMLSTLLHCLCSNFPCTANVLPSPRNIQDMKWVAYSACIAYPIFLLFADRDLRLASIRALFCRRVQNYKNSNGTARKNQTEDGTVDRSSSSAGSSGRR